MFKTRKSDGRVFNDARKRSDAHHGSVKPTTGIRMDQKLNSSADAMKKLDDEWNKNNGRYVMGESFTGTVKGDPNVDYVKLMKNMGIFSSANYAQWKKDGHTDKEIFDILYEFDKRKKSYSPPMLHGIPISDMAQKILQKTKDGNELSPEHLYLLQETINGNINEKGEVAFYELYKNALNGYKKPWFHGIENMTTDHEGYVYWKGIPIEHYSFQSRERETMAAKELAKDIQTMESRGIKINNTNLSRYWKEKNEKKGK